MKKHSILLLSSSIMITSLVLAGCESAITSSTVQKGKLRIESGFLDSYYRFEKLNLSDIQVYGSLNGSDYSAVEGYVITGTDNDLKDGDLLETAGTFNFAITLSGYEDLAFSITVNEVNVRSSSLEIVSTPTKQSFEVGDTLDLSGLSVQLTGRISKDGKTQRFTESISSYTTQIVVDGTPVDTDGFVFKSCGIYEVVVTYVVDSTRVCTRSFSVICYGDQSVGPQDLSDEHELMAEDSEEMTVTVSNPNKSDDKGYYSPDEVEYSFTLSEMNANSYYNWHRAPSIGKTPILVIPIVIPGYESDATDSNLEVIKKTTFGSSSDLNFESLHSYYYKSSYGQLDFTGLVTDYYYPSQNPIGTHQTSNSITGTDDVIELVEESVEWAKITYNLDMKKFDSDSDGMIDAVWAVYIHNTPVNGDNIYWAFSTSAGNEENIDNPVVNNFGWCGIDFLTGKITSSGVFNNPDKGMDAHVLIHETGHMLGLNDYYSYNTSGTYNTYSPLGLVDMMDNNVGDHNTLSKILLGWIKPYVVTGDATITLKSSQSKDNVILIPYDEKEYSFTDDGKLLLNPYDEYILVDFYTDSNLNSQDYPAYGVQSVKGQGGRIYHADKRLATVDALGNISSIKLLSDPDDVLTTDLRLYEFITNTEKSTSSLYAENVFGYNSLWDELRWISANKKVINTQSGISGRLFSAGQTFSLEDYSDSFVNGKLDGDYSFSWTVTFDSIK